MHLNSSNLSKLYSNVSNNSSSDLSSSNTSLSINDNNDINDLDISNLSDFQFSNNNIIKESSLEALLDLKQISHDTFINKSELFIPYRGRGLFGGTMAAQSILAALLYSNNLEKSWKPISIHCHFLHAAQTNPKLYYKVTNLKTGKNYLTQEINLFQNDKLIFKAIVSLQSYQLLGSASNLEGQLNHHRKAPIIGKDIDHFDDMFTQTDLFKIWSKRSMNKKHLEYLKGENCENEVIKCYNREPCIWKLPLNMFDYDKISDDEKNLDPSMRTLRYWVKNKEILKNPSIFNWVSIAYISDYFYLSANMRLNLHEMFTTKFSVSLDHTIYFNNEIDTSSFFNYNIKNIKAGENRSIMFGEMFSIDGTLAATTVQEGLSVVYND
jgi:acyl-coenzyme A thioesterase 1/2/4